MLTTFEYIHAFYLAIAIILEIIANLLLKLSSGLKYKWYALAAIIAVLFSFTALSFAVHGIQLSVAYAIWGGFGLIATTLMGIFFFKEPMHFTGWLGMVAILFGMLLMKFS